MVFFKIGFDGLQKPFVFGLKDCLRSWLGDIKILRSANMNDVTLWPIGVVNLCTEGCNVPKLL